MSHRHEISREEAAERRQRRAEARASLACEGLYLTPEEESFFERLDEECLTPEERAERVLKFTRARRRHRSLAAIT